jgi:hypothetical protein
MTQDQKLKYLRCGASDFRNYPWHLCHDDVDLAVGVGWEPRQPEYEQMIMGIYATLGVFLILAARNPTEHLSLIRFTIWSSFVHGGIMLVQAIVDENERANLLGDIPALFLVAIVLWVLVPKKREA